MARSLSFVKKKKKNSHYGVVIVLSRRPCECEHLIVNWFDCRLISFIGFSSDSDDEYIASGI